MGILPSSASNPNKKNPINSFNIYRFVCTLYLNNSEYYLNG